MADGKVNYMDRIRGEFVSMALGKGVEETAAHELGEYLIEKMMNSFRGGLKAGKENRPQRIAATA